jgi:hypothetical protein
MKAASRARDFSRFSYSLSASDSLHIRSHENSGTSIGPYDTGFVITHNAKPIRDVTLRGLSELRNEETWYSESFTTLAVTRACRGADPIYFITMQYMGDRTSPALIFTIIPSQQGYKVSTVPLISGGVLDVSVSNPLHLRTWTTCTKACVKRVGQLMKLRSLKFETASPSGLDNIERGTNTLQVSSMISVASDSFRDQVRARQPQVFRLRFASLNMTSLWWCSDRSNRGCFDSASLRST